MIEKADLAEFAERGPMFHLLWDATPGKVTTALESGLERTVSNYTGFWESRPDHVYIGTLTKVKRMRKNGWLDEDSRKERGGGSEWALFTVDVGQLDHRRVNPDEDHFGLQQSKHGLERAQRFRLPVSPCKWAWDWAKYLKIVPPPSLGEWAEQIGLGDDPATTVVSAREGSLAYRGVIPPAAVTLTSTSWENPC